MSGDDRLAESDASDGSYENDNQDTEPDFSGNIKRKALSIREKIQVIEACQSMSYSKAGEMFKISKNTVSSMMRRREAIFRCAFETGLLKERKRLRTGKYPQVERALVNWTIECRKRGIPISGPSLKQKAEEISKSLDIIDFRCSAAFIQRFKDRNGITFRCIDQKRNYHHTESDATSKIRFDESTFLEGESAESVNATVLVNPSNERSCEFDLAVSKPVNAMDTATAAVLNGLPEVANIKSVDMEEKPRDHVDSESSASSHKKFRVVSLYFPTDYNNEVLLDLMHAAQSFHLWFEADSQREDRIKKGGLSLTFHSDAAAKEAYSKARGQIINGLKIKLQAPKWFEQEIKRDQVKIEGDNNLENAAEATEKNRENLSSSEIAAISETHQHSAEDPFAKYKLYVSQLLPTTDEDLVYAVFGQENLRNVEIMPDALRKDGTKVAILTFHTPELAEQSMQDYDGFVVDDGELSKPMKIVLFSDRSTSVNDSAIAESSIEQEVETAARLNRSNADDCQSERDAEQPLSKKRSAKATTSALDDHHDDKGKAGNLWSAQIVSQRSGDGAWETITHALEVKPSKSIEQRSVFDSTTDEFNVQLSEIELSQLINNHVHTERINYAELHSLEDLWKLVHQATDHIGWQPEQNLKAAMLNSLHNALTVSEAHWWRRHVEFLIKLWKKESEQETRSRARKHARETAGVASLPTAANGGDDDVIIKADDVIVEASTASKIVDSEMTMSLTPSCNAVASASPAPSSAVAASAAPPPSSASRKRKGGSEGKRALIELMGVGAFLASVKRDNAAAEAKEAEEESKDATAEQAGSHETHDVALTGKRRRRRSSSVEHGRERHRSSSCESGEASSTTSGGDEDEDFRTTIKSLASRQPPPPPPPPPPPRNRSERRSRQRRSDDDDHQPTSSEHRRRYDSNEKRDEYLASTATGVRAAASSSGSQVQPAGQTQAMPAVMQMMPMMMQMFQQQQRGATSVNPHHFQQQFAQLYQQIQAQMGGTQAGAFPALSSQMIAQMAQQRLAGGQLGPQSFVQSQQGSQQLGVAPPFVQQQQPTSSYPAYR